MHIKYNSCAVTVILGSLGALCSVLLKHCADVALRHCSVLLPFLSQPAAEWQNNIIYCVTTYKITPTQKGLVGHFLRLGLGWFGKTLHAISDIVFTLAKLSKSANGRSQSVHVGEAPPSSSKCRQMHHFVINENSCSSTDCKWGPAENGDKTNLPLRNVVFETITWFLAAIIYSSIRKWATAPCRVTWRTHGLYPDVVIQYCHCFKRTSSSGSVCSDNVPFWHHTHANTHTYPHTRLPVN